jgi:hypothetical protein
VAEGATWFVRSDQLYTVGSDVYGHDAVFTDCELERPHYHFGAGELKVIRNDILVARDVTFSFADVPVFWFPFFVQSLKRGRRSGILTPRFGINDIARTSSNYNRSIDNVGFYWAISDYFGAETALSWQSNNYTALRGTLEYRFIRQFLAGSVTYRNYWKAEGGRDFTLNANNNWQPDERTTLTAQVGYATSTRFVRQRSIDPREINQSIDSNLSLNRRFNWGSFTSGATRKQYLSDGTVAFSPSAGLTLNSITLFEALPGDEKWYSNIVWTGSGRASVNSRSIADDNPSPTAQGNRQFNGNMSSSVSLGSFSWGQNFQVTDDALRARDFDVDSLDLAGNTVRRTQWSTNLSYQQRLIGTSTLTPSLGIRGETLYGDTTKFQTLAAPTRIDFSASLATAVFGFWPGIGPIERIRHRLSPSFSYSYSPEPTSTQDQKDIFGITAQEQNRLSIGINQTFEAKFRKKAEPEGRAPAARDSVAADSLAVARPAPHRHG